jgi:ComF family protein
MGAVWEWVYPSKCGLCSLLTDTSPCEVCRSEMAIAQPDFLEERPDSPLSYRACMYAYSGRAAQAVRRLKYSRCTSLSSFMAECVAKRLSEVSEAQALVVPVPLHRSRRALRGFNQAELCTQGIEKNQVRTNLLFRVRATRPQAGLSLKEREKNLSGAFHCAGAVSGRLVVLVDDVVTSGHTARECARTLIEQGARSVGIVAFCGNLD